MKSMAHRARGSQVVPDGERGIVVGVDVSQETLDYGAFRPDSRGAVAAAGQDEAGFAKLGELVAEFEGQGREVWVAFEPTGPYSTCLARWLRGHGARVVQVNPYHVKRTKKVRDNSPHKSDGKDPGVIADLVWQGCYQQVMASEGVYAELRVATREWASLVKKRTAIRNELHAHLTVWFPELRTVFKDSLCQSVRGMVRRFGSPQEAVRKGVRSVRAALRQASSGRTTKRAGAVWQAATATVAPPQGQQARRRSILASLTLLELVEARQEQLGGELEALLAQLPEAQSLVSVAGVGTITAAGLLGECGDLGAYDTYAQVEKHLGLNLYSISSGKRQGRCHISKRGCSWGRYLMCHIGLMQTRRGGRYHEFAQRQKQQGKSTGQIRVAAGRKLLRLLYALARDRALYDPGRSLTGAGARDGQVIH